VSGVGVGRGYLKDKERTAGAFMEDPFREEKGVRLYKTGDLGRWLPDGTIEFFGRKDYQVKIRGYRIEPGEIESRLKDFEGIKEAVVIDRTDESGNKYLCAYIVAWGKLKIPAVKNYLLQVLPDYMTPSYFMELEKIPLTPNGKVDRNALPGISAESMTTIPYIDAAMLEQLVIPVENVGKKPLTLGSDLDGEVEYELSGEERDKLLHTFNDTNVEYPPAKTLVDLFGEQVEKTPDNIALVGMTYDQWLKTQDAEHQGAGSSVPNSLSYRVLDEKSNQLAHYLLRRGTRPNDSVALKLERTLEMIISMLAVLKTGCVYVPLNPKAPDAMNRFILQECRVKILLTPLELAEMDLDHLPTGKPGIEIKPTAFAYTMFTSGSTGTPKGVSITHANLFSLLHWGYKKLDIDAQQRTVQNLAYYFDWSVWEIFITLTTGAVLVMVTEEILQNPRKTITFLIENAITVFHVTPTQYSSITGVGEDKLVDLKYLFLGAEKLTVELLEKSLRTVGQNCRVFNMYGPTECTIINAVFEINRAVDLRQAYGNLSSIPIGSPAGNTALLILDPYSRLCPINTVGQLYIGGDSVACGYLNNPELTAEKFRPLITQMAQIENKSFFRGSRGAVFSKKAPLIYKTGDLARWLADGNIEFLGRTDYQVKLSGIRIEPGDIESQLMAHNDIETAVVIARENEKKEIYFCAYLVSPKRLTASELAGYLYEKIPFYMVPSYFIQLEKIPLTPNGKVNRRLIERIEIKKDETQGFRPPVNEVEEKLAGVWAEVLGIPKDSISTVANFFDLGGHSLKAINMIAKIHKVLDIKLPLSEVFKNPRIKGLAEYIAGLAKDKYTAITPVEKKEYYELSSAQKRLYFLQQMTPESTAYNMPMIIPSWEEEDIEKLVGAFGKLINRHESLRTSFHMIANEPVQRVHDRVEFTIGRCDSINVQPGVSKDNQDYSSQLLQFTKPFDLSQAPLLRASTVQTGEGKLLLLVDMHHIISDAASHDVLAKDFMALYRGETLTPLSLHYKDYSGWQNSQKQKEAIQKQELYWLNEFKRHDELPVLQLPDDYPRPLIQDFEGSSVNFSVNEQETQTLMKLQGETGTTLYMVILSVWSLLLSKLSGQEDIITGTPVAGRRHSDLEHIIGMFVNTLPIRTFPVGGKTFKEFLNEVKKCTLDAFENQDYPFEDLVDKISPHRDISRNPIFDVMYNLLTADDSQEKIAGVEEADSTGFKHIPGTSKFDITLTSSQQGKRIFNNIRYSTKLFKPTTIERIISYFKNILFSLSSNAGTEIADVEIISREEKKRLLNEFNNTGTAYPQEKTIYELFVEQAGKTPDYIAVIGPGGMSITYEELNRKSNQLALLLREKGVEPDMVVGIMAERSVEMVVGLMGILKSGGAYMPINPEYPQERIDYMLKDSNAKVLIINKSEIRNPKLETNPNNQNLNDQNKKRNSGAALVLNFENLNFEFVSNFVLRASNLFSSNLAYIIYTSGSTGKPKGVMIAHNALMNRLNWMQRNYPIGQGDVILQKTTFTFDVSVWELFWWSMSGAALCLLEPGGEKDPGQITLTIERNHISTMHFVPSMLSIFLDYVQANNQAKKLSTLKWVFTSGEALLPVHVERFNELLPRENDVALANLYGPTEATIDVSYFNCLEKKEREVIPIGKPIDNINLYILDKNFHHQPIGMIGELYILGTGLARGYLNRSELTAEKFINFHHLSFLLNGRLRWGLHHSKLYRTGDLARWLPDGNIEFMGRIDLQVKIRGFRIELGEIENQLLKHKCIKEAVVVINVNTMKDKNLTAYVISTDKLLEIELREYLQQKLPDYMIPSHFVQLEKIPLTPNGKLDRKALPKPELKVSESYIAPKDEIEKKMAVIWSEVLDQTVIGVDDNFFHLGGHSLKATILVSKIHKVFQVNVPLAEIFKTPTIRNLSNYIKVADKDRYVSISPVEKKEYYTLSSAQKRLYILYQMDPQGIGYNIPSLLALEGEIDKEKLEQTFRQLIHRHESLRTSFYMINDVPVQRIHEELEFEIEYLAAKNTNEREDGRGAPPWSPFIRPFELSNAPLLRVGLVKEKGDRQILMVDMHHIISDGTSMNILVNDFMAMYQGENLSGLQVQYKDFSNWQNSEKQVESLKLQGEYWLNEFASEIPALELPVDYPRPAVQSFEGSNIHFEIDKETTVVLKNLALETDVTIYMVLLSLYTVFLAKLTNQEDIIIGSPIAGRRHADLEKIIGMFVNTLALRNFPSGEKRFMDFLREVKEKTLNAFENQDYPYEKLVNQVVINREISRNPLFDVIFLLQNMDIAGINIPGLKLTPYPYENKTAKSDLRLTGIEEENKLLFTFEYCTKLFKKETVERFIVYFKNIVKSIVADTKRKISDFEILTVEEKKQILFDFNDTEAEYPKDKTIHQLFVEQALESPDHIAIVGESIVETPCAASVQYQFQITYHELNNQSNRLAGLLIEKGVLPDTIVGIMIERSIEMIIGIFGILKSGGAYLPIDPMYPQERIDHMLKDSAAKFLAVANNKEGEKVRRWEGEKMLLESIFHPANHLFYQHSALELPRILHSNHLCYIIYTSGSTGRPKGVMVDHHSVVNYIKWAIKNYIKNEENVSIPLFTPLSFDLTVTSVFTPLLSGNSILAYKETFIDKIIEDNRVEVIKLTPSHLKIILEISQKLKSNIKRFIVGGESLETKLAENITGKFNKSLEIYNEYGPTEATVGCMIYRFSNDYGMLTAVPIGTPAANVQIYILDKNRKPVPVGVPGEIYIGGECVARGYLNCPELTAEKFIKNNRSNRTNIFYKTGDLGRWQPD
ncbi:MAG: amino acid adenylation domain-containing protein, partial [Acidobacteria bacterium]|nr:amino acid adenylation domain-containing protein [Acidobacteriota bacterium]